MSRSYREHRDSREGYTQSEEEAYHEDTLIIHCPECKEVLDGCTCAYDEYNEYLDSVGHDDWEYDDGYFHDNY
jgi:hypothetical protein